MGETCVGKTAIVDRFVMDQFKTSYLPTLGLNSSVKKYKTPKGDEVTLSLFDIAGQEAFSLSRRHYYAGAKGIIFVYDVTNPVTLEAIKEWKDEVESAIGTDYEAILAGGKADLGENIPLEEGKKLAEELGWQLFITSAKTSQNVDKVFESLIQALIKKRKQK